MPLNLTHHRVYICYGCGHNSICIHIGNEDPDGGEVVCEDSSWRPATDNEIAEIVKRYQQ